MRRVEAVTGALAVSAFVLLPLLERARPLRPTREAPWRRDLRNLAMAAASFATLSLLERPIVQPLSRAVERRRVGLVHRLPWPAWLRDTAAVLLMDHTLYVWHVLTHRSPALWRLHRIHHADLDCSASTAIRFHFAEMALSVPWRAAQVALIGTSPRVLKAWRNLLFASILFHHSNLRLPAALDRRLSRWIVTPRMHGLHHSALRVEHDSNWSSIFSIWDDLHGTRLPDRPQPGEIGVPEFREPPQVGLGRMLALPFRPPAQASVRAA